MSLSTFCRLRAREELEAYSVSRGLRLEKNSSRELNIEQGWQSSGRPQRQRCLLQSALLSAPSGLAYLGLPCSQGPHASVWTF